MHVCVFYVISIHEQKQKRAENQAIVAGFYCQASRHNIINILSKIDAHTKKDESNAKMNDKTISALTDLDKDGDLSPKQKRAFIKMLSRFIRCAIWSIFHHYLIGSQWKKCQPAWQFQWKECGILRVFSLSLYIPLSLSLSLSPFRSLSSSQFLSTEYRCLFCLRKI